MVPFYYGDHYKPIFIKQIFCLYLKFFAEIKIIPLLVVYTRIYRYFSQGILLANKPFQWLWPRNSDRAMTLRKHI